MPINSKQKGNRGERELAKALNSLFPNLGARRGQQFSGSPDSPDVVSKIDRLLIESKRVDRLDLFAALAKATEDAQGKIPIVCHRPNGKPWVVSLYLDNLPALVEIISEFLQSSRALSKL